MNQNEVDMPTQTTIDQLEPFIQFLLLCAFYGKSVYVMWSFKQHFSYFEKLISSMGGIDKFKHVLRCQKHHGDTWDKYFDRCGIMREMEQVVSKIVHP